LKSDLYSIEDTFARKRAAVKVLEELGYAVSLERRGPVRKPLPPKVKLRLVEKPPATSRIEQPLDEEGRNK